MFLSVGQGPPDSFRPWRADHSLSSVFEYTEAVSLFWYYYVYSDIPSVGWDLAADALLNCLFQVCAQGSAGPSMVVRPLCHTPQGSSAVQK